MAGVKGRSGRKSHFDQQTANELITLSSKIIRDALNSPDLPLQVKADLAAKIYVKAMPQNIAFESDVPVFQLVVMNQTIKNRLTEHNAI